jgi:transposase
LLLLTADSCEEACKAMERLVMTKVREILRLRWALAASVRETARGAGVSAGVVSNTERRSKTAGLDWATVESLDDVQLERRLYGGPKHARGPTRMLPDPAWMHAELRRPGVTLELLHLEYLRDQPEGYRYTAFCEAYRQWLKRRGVVMRQHHKAGDKTFVDYSGKKPSVVDATTGEVVDVELFVAVLGASNLTFAEATRTQTMGDFVASHVRAFEYFGGVTRLVVPDQLRSAVRVPCRYEPTVTRTYAELGRHYGTAIVPARPGKPRDKAKVEVAVQVAQRWILARLRNETFFSIEVLNERIGDLLEELNARPMRKLGGVSRAALFERVERAALLPLPADRFVVSEWRRATVNVDYHVALFHHFYSVPYPLIREEVEARLTATTVEIFHRNRRVASHARSDARFRFTTDPAHMPEAHQKHFAGGDAVIAWGASVGPMTEAMVRRLLDANPVREQGWRSAKGLQRLTKKYGEARVEAACAHALHFGARSYKPVERLLELGREQLELPGAHEPTTAIAHENVRGPRYFH